jgi:hypothetical protein
MNPFQNSMFIPERLWHYTGTPVPCCIGFRKHEGACEGGKKHIYLDKFTNEL